MSDSDATEPCEIVPDCPVCGSKLHVAHAHSKLKICVCRACGTSLSIPDESFALARVLKQAKAATSG